MSNTLINPKKTYNLVCLSLGGNKYTGDEPPGKDWSPNNFKSINILPDVLIIETHVGDMYDSPFVSPNEFDPKALVGALTKRKLGKLERISVHPNMGGLQLAKDLATYLHQAGYSRLHAYGEFNIVNGDVVMDGYDLTDTDDWFMDTTLEPEHYEFDNNPKLIEVLELAKRVGLADGKELGDVEELESEDSGGLEDTEEIEELEDSEAPGEPTTQGTALPDGDEIRDEVTRYYKPITKSVIDNILRNYGYIFASGYEVVKPKGMLIPYTLKGRKGTQDMGGLFYLDESNTLQRSKATFDMEAIYSTLQGYTGKLQTIESRSNMAISTAIASTPTTDGFYIPYKLMEYAFGREKSPTDDETDLNRYEPHADANTWDGYVKGELRPALENTLMYTITSVLVQKGIVKEVEDVPHPDTRAYVGKLLKEFEKVFCHVYLVSKFDEVGDDIVSIKFRILDPYNRLPRDKNILVDALQKSRNVDVSKNAETLVYYPVVEGDYFVEYQVDIDRNLAQAEPLFAYRALEVLKKQGKKIDYDHAIIGKGIDDSILSNDGKITFKNKLTHLVIAGSRAGKGVWTLNTTAAAILSGKVVAYIDNKPDIGDLVASLADNVFVMNGRALTYNPDKGTGFFQEITPAKLNPLLGEGRVPPYVADALGSEVWSSPLGTVGYVRSVLFWMGILSARANGTMYEELGGDDGIILIADEVANAMGNMEELSGLLGSTYAATGYKALVEAEGQEKAEKKIPKPTEIGYWGAYLVKSFKDSLRSLSAFDRAGFKNGENTKSDIFLILQDPLHYHEFGNPQGYKALFPQDRSKNTNGILGKPFTGAVLSNLLLRGESDLFVGYHPNKNYLGIKDNPQGTAGVYLNQISRNFAYVENYDEDRIETDKDAKTATYYKPMLIFPEGSQENYFVRNALEAIENFAGVSPDKIIQLNEDPDNPGRINPAVGMRAYLNMAGASDEDIAKSLNRSGDIADMVAVKLGYPDSGPGTWRKFIADMRPEWIFSTQDIVDVLAGNTGTLPETVDKRLPEFVFAYPELFGGASDAGEGEIDLSGMEDGWGGSGDSGEAGGSYDLGDDLDGNGVPDHLEDQGGSSDYDIQAHYNQGYRDAERGTYNNVYLSGKAEDLVAAYDQGQRDFAGQGQGNLGAGQDYDNPYQAEEEYTDQYEGAGNEGSGSQEFLGAEAVGGTKTSWKANEDDVDTAKLPVVEQDTFGSQGEYEPTVQEALTDFVKGLKDLDFKNPETLLHSLEGLLSVVETAQRRVPPTNESTLAGKMEAPKVQKLGNLHSFDREDPNALALLKDNVTRGMYASIGGPANLRTLAIVDKDVLVNKSVYRPRFRAEFVQSLPVDLRRQAATGKVVGLVNWRTLKDTGGKVTSLAFDSEAILREFVSPQLGWKGRVSVPNFFRQFPSLQVLHIGDEKYTRQGYRKQVADRKDRVDEGAFLSLTDSFGNKRGQSSKEYFGKAREHFGNKKRWFIAYGALGLANGAGSLGAKAASGTARISSGTLSRLRYALTDTKNL